MSELTDLEDRCKALEARAAEVRETLTAADNDKERQAYRDARRELLNAQAQLWQARRQAGKA